MLLRWGRLTDDEQARAIPCLGAGLQDPVGSLGLRVGVRVMLLSDPPAPPGEPPEGPDPDEPPPVQEPPAPIPIPGDPPPPPLQAAGQAGCG